MDTKTWRKNNQEHCKRYNAEYYRQHKEEILASKGQYYQENKERILEQHRPYLSDYYQKNKDKLKQRARQHYKENKAKKLEYQRQYSKVLDPLEKRQYHRNYCANNSQKIKAIHEKSYIKKMRSIYGPNWQLHHFHGEALTASILETIFPNAKIKRGREGEIDTLGTCVRKHVRPDFRFVYLDKDIIVEYNGEQHYRHIPAMMPLKKFLEIQERDAWLRDYCQKNNKILIEIDERKVHTDKNKIEAKLRTELQKHGIL
jgi:hypothetical protein